MADLDQTIEELEKEVKAELEEAAHDVKVAEMDDDGDLDNFDNCPTNTNEDQLDTLQVNEFYWNQLIGLTAYLNNRKK